MPLNPTFPMRETSRVGKKPSPSLTLHERRLSAYLPLINKVQLSDAPLTAWALLPWSRGLLVLARRQPLLPWIWTGLASVAEMRLRQLRSTEPYPRSHHSRRCCHYHDCACFFIQIPGIMFIAHYNFKFQLDLNERSKLYFKLLLLYLLKSASFPWLTSSGTKETFSKTSVTKVRELAPWLLPMYHLSLFAVYFWSSAASSSDICEYFSTSK